MMDILLLERYKFDTDMSWKVPFIGNLYNLFPEKSLQRQKGQKFTKHYTENLRQSNNYLLKFHI